MRLVTLGVGAQNSPRYAPAGLLVAHAGVRVMLDGGPGAVPRGRLDAWLVTDEDAELITDIRRLAGPWKLVPRAVTFRRDGLGIVRRRVVHTSHLTYGYRIEAAARVVVWAPEFFIFPRWARGADLMFAEVAGWDRPSGLPEAWEGISMPCTWPGKLGRVRSDGSCSLTSGDRPSGPWTGGRSFPSESSRSMGNVSLFAPGHAKPGGVPAPPRVGP